MAFYRESVLVWTGYLELTQFEVMAKSRSLTSHRIEVHDKPCARFWVECVPLPHAGHYLAADTVMKRVYDFVLHDADKTVTITNLPIAGFFRHVHGASNAGHVMLVDAHQARVMILDAMDFRILRGWAVPDGGGRPIALDWTGTRVASLLEFGVGNVKTAILYSLDADTGKVVAATPPFDTSIMYSSRLMELADGIGGGRHHTVAAVAYVPGAWLISASTRVLYVRPSCLHSSTLLCDEIWTPSELDDPNSMTFIMCLEPISRTEVLQVTRFYPAQPVRAKVCVLPDDILQDQMTLCRLAWLCAWCRACRVMEKK